MDGKIKTFKDLEAWKKGHELVMRVYSMTDDFPQKEIFGLTSQMKRAAVSITSNIAEGFERHSGKEKVQFYSVAKGSLAEIQNQALIAKDAGFIREEILNELDLTALQVHKMLNGLIRTASSRPY